MKDSRILKEELLQGNYEELFREIYQDDSEAKRQNARYAQAVEKFEELFGEKQVEIYSAPGRSEIGCSSVPAWANSSHTQGQSSLRRARWQISRCWRWVKSESLVSWIKQIARIVLPPVLVILCSS